MSAADETQEQQTVETVQPEEPVVAPITTSVQDLSVKVRTDAQSHASD